MNQQQLEELCRELPPFTRLEVEVADEKTIAIVDIEAGALKAGFRTEPPVSVAFAYAKLSSEDRPISVRIGSTFHKVSGYRIEEAPFLSDPYTSWDALILRLEDKVDPSEYAQPPARKRYLW